MKMIKRILILLAIMLPLSAYGQFYVTGDDPGRLRWNFIDTESYRVIYPQGSDSLAFTYAKKLEKYKIPVSRSSGYMTGEGDGKIMPVVIHAYNDANGSVAWAPKRMDMFAVPSAYDPEPFPWSTMLSVHESRHVSQMQFGLTQRQKPGKWFIGEGWNIIAFLLYPGTSKTEGDAVVAETALTSSGRGRMADFLNYFWVALDNGDDRGWFKWRFSSQKRYSPSYYALGYMTIGGFRYKYDHPLMISEGLHMVAEHPIRFGCLYKVNKQVTGMKWEDMWQDVSGTMHDIWKADADKRAPYIPSERVTAEPGIYTDYTDNLIVGNDIYAVKKGHVDTPVLVRIDNEGNEYKIRNFAYTTSGLRLDETSDRIYWSENIPDKRWTLKSGSAVRYLSEDGKAHTVRKDQLLYNPVSKDGQTAVTRYHPDGHSSIEILDANNGSTIESISAPDSLQIVETAWLDDKIYMTAVSECGYGIYATDTNDCSIIPVLEPQPVMIKDFGTHGEELIFACDRTGVHELYHFNPVTKDLRQRTSTRYGAYDFQYSTDGEYLYYSSQTVNGKHIFRTPSDSLIDRKARFDSLYRYPIAEKITQQEKELAREQGYADAVTIDVDDVEVSEPKRYRKVPHMFNLHTWFPAYVSVDNIMNSMSFDPLWQTISLGVSGVMQNHLATATGELGYSAHKDSYNPERWRHSGHLRFTYSGLYPIFQFSIDFNDRSARQFSTYALPDGSVYRVDSRELNTPYFYGNASMYIPFNFTSGGWSKGLIPKLSYTVTNDMFNTGTILTEIPDSQRPLSFVGYEEGKIKPVQQLTGSVRGYTMMKIANSQVYPRCGIGAEIGFVSRLDAYKVFSPMGYAYTYGYIPGFTRTQGFKFTAMWQRKLSDEVTFSQQVVSILPRGISNGSLGSHLTLYNKNLVKLTADYAIPIHIGDVTLGGNILAIKRLVAYPHYDYTFIGNEGLWSAGTDLTADLHAIMTIEWPCSVGLTFSWNGGSAWERLSADGMSMNRWYIGPIFNVSF